MSEPRRGRGRPPQVPPTPREPIGRDRASTAGRPAAPSRVRAGERPTRPTFPPDAEIDLPPRVRKEIDRLVHERARATEVKLALSLGTVASEEDEHDVARGYLLWAKHLAPRSAVVRETLGIALYRGGDLRAALSELQAYRRLSGAVDQNHLLADCLRADGREVERAIEVGMALVDDEEAEIERRVEAAIVVAAVHLDLGRAPRAAAVLDRFLAIRNEAQLPPSSLVRLLWVAADAAEAEGDDGRAVTCLERLERLEPDYPDLPERLSRLRGGPDR